MIQIKQVNFKYKNSNEYTLKNINLNIQKGEFITIIGKNGSGKSTFAKLLAGIYKLKEGEILVDGISVAYKKKFLDLRKKIGIVFQNPDNQVIFPTVYDDISFALKNLKIDNIEEKIESAIQKVGMKGFEKSDTYSLSLGQKQRIAIAEVLAIDTPYIVLDEPTTMIDSKGKEEIYKILLELKKQGYTIIYVTNLIDEILLSDRSVLIQNGEIKHIFEKKDILNQISILEENEIKVPEIVKAIEQLNKQGIPIELKDWTMDEMVKEIVRLKK